MNVLGFITLHNVSNQSLAIQLALLGAFLRYSLMYALQGSQNLWDHIENVSWQVYDNS